MTFIDILIENTNNQYYKLNSVLFGANLGYYFHELVEPYIGAGIGINFDSDDFLHTIEYAWKADAGLRFSLFDILCLRAEVSYGSVLGFSGLIGVGVIF